MLSNLQCRLYRSGCRLEPSKNKIVFYVKDTGIGISEENQQVIFDRFRKIDESSSHVYRGAGLGLSIASHLVSMMGGEIRVESKLGDGATFYFTLR